MTARTAALALGALLIFATVYGARADARARTAVADSRASRTAATAALTSFEQGQRVSDSALAVAQAQLRAAHALRKRVDTLRITFEEQAAAAPDTCAHVIAAGRAALAASRAENDELLGSIGQLSFAHELLRTRANTLADSTRALVSATKRLERVVARRKWFVPELRVTAGVGPRGTDVVVGPSWRLF